MALSCSLRPVTFPFYIVNLKAAVRSVVGFCTVVGLERKSQMLSCEEQKIAYFREDDETNCVKISFNVHYNPFKLCKPIAICRPKNESLFHLFHKMNLKVASVLDKPLKKISDKQNIYVKLPDVDSALFINGRRLKDDVPYQRLFQVKGDIKLQVLDNVYDVLFNPPWVEAINLPKMIKSDTVVFPVKFETSHMKKEDANFKWFKSEQKDPSRKLSPRFISKWTQIGDGFFYSVTNDDVGHYLKFTCEPKTENMAVPIFSVVSLNVVEPSICDYEFRRTHLLTKEKVGDDKIRILDYNILAELYSTTKLGKAMFHYCPEMALSICQRMPSICVEISGYNADIICLQEVQSSAYTGHILPVLQTQNFTGEFAPKQHIGEGTACFYRNDKFEWMASMSYTFGVELKENNLFKDLSKKLNENFLDRFVNLPHGFQLLVLKCVHQPNRILVVANLHLYSVGDADTIRLIQLLIAFNLCQSTCKNLTELMPHCNTSIILCGDFNSTPDDSLHHFLVNKSVGADHKCWDADEVKTEGFPVSHDMMIESAFGTPEYTTYTECFKGCLDYIYYQMDFLEVDRIFPLPDEEKLKEHVGLPSIHFPSDHLPLIADLKWKS